MNESEAVTLFKRWYVDPINKLKELPNGDGGFIAFMASLALYERLIKAKLKLRNLSPNKENVKSEMMKDLDLTDKEQSIFWDIFRNGLLHYAMPKKGETGWIFHATFSNKPTFRTYDGVPVVCINPWEFTEKVLQEFLSDPELIIASESFPFPYIMPIQLDKFSKSQIPVIG